MNFRVTHSKQKGISETDATLDLILERMYQKGILLEFKGEQYYLRSNRLSLAINTCLICDPDHNSGARAM